MSQFRYPTVDLEFIKQCLIESGKLEDGGIIKCIEGTKFIMAGPQAVHKRTTTAIEVEPGQIGFEQAIGIGIRYKFLSKVLDWLEKNRNWKDGAYIKRYQ